MVESLFHLLKQIVLTSSLGSVLIFVAEHQNLASDA